jgi:ATP-binding cassette, subfamily B, bacterial MsbA
MNLISRLFKYILRYKTPLICSIFLGFTASFLNIFNIVAFKPVLEVMFMSNETSEEAEESPGEEKYTMPVIRSIENKIKPYRDAIDRKMDEITSWALKNKMKAIYIICIVVCMSGFLKAASTYGSDYLMIFTGMSLVKDMRQEIHEHILSMDFSFFSDNSSGHLLARSSNDVNALKNSIISIMDVGIQAPITIIMTLLFMYYLSPQLTLYSITVVPFAGIFIALFGKKIRKVSKKAQKQFADVVDVMQETYDGIRVVKAFGMESFESARFKKANLKAFSSFLKRQAIRKINSPIMEFLGILSAALVLMGGAKLIIGDHSMKGSDFLIFIFAVTRLYRPVKSLSKIHLQVQSGLAGAERVFEILDTECALIEKADAVSMPHIKKSITFQDVSFSYGKAGQYSLRDINLKIPRGSVIALVGRSGAGKTTFANLLCRFYDATEGKITIDGEDLRNFTFQSLREKISIVTQETVLFNDTIKKNIAYGREDIEMKEIIHAAKLAYAHEFIERLPDKYDTHIGTHGGRLSGGQRQRISIARAILRNPDILVFDEATSALDSEAEKKIQQAMENLIKDRTTFIIAHRLSTVKMADNILVLDNGKLVENGSHENLLDKNGVYTSLCKHQGIFADTKEEKSPVL